MVIVRMVFRARQGKIGQMVERFKQAPWLKETQARILTDLSGPMNTLVVEERHASLAAAEQWRSQLFRRPEFRDTQTRDDMEAMIESGNVEYYTIEHE